MAWLAQIVSRHIEEPRRYIRDRNLRGSFHHRSATLHRPQTRILVQKSTALLRIESRPATRGL